MDQVPGCAGGGVCEYKILLKSVSYFCAGVSRDVRKQKGSECAVWAEMYDLLSEAKRLGSV